MRGQSAGLRFSSSSGTDFEEGAQVVQKLRFTEFITVNKRSNEINVQLECFMQNTKRESVWVWVLISRFHKTLLNVK